MMRAIYCSSGKRFGNREVKRKFFQLPKSQRKFINQCPAYGLTPDFYHALCLDKNTGEEFYLEGFSGDYCELTGGDVDMFVDFEKVQQMLLDALDQEMADLPCKADLLLGVDEKHDKRVLSEARRDIKARKGCVETAKKYANPAMHEIFAEMGLPEYPGVVYYGSIYEFVSYKPNLGYVLENLDRNRYDAGRYSVVQFESLKNGMKAYAAELEPDQTTHWLQMVENMRPANVIPVNGEDASCTGQLFFSF